ncbi:MAG: MFS transporter [Acidimicrobiia bacterium]|nr:MFS transporter [Acidimicrobiia bacterium]
MDQDVPVDLTPIRENRQYRLLFGSGLITGLGSATTFVAMPYQVADITGSYVAVGILGLLEIVPLVVFGLWGGVLADRLDRRTMVLATEVAFMVGVLVLLFNAWRGDAAEVWPIYVVAVLISAIDSLQRPSLESIVPRVVPPGQLAAAGALNSFRGSAARVAGPALGGFLITFGGVEAAYVFDLVSFVVSATLISRLSRVPSLREEHGHPWQELKQAFGYVRTRRDILGTYVCDTLAMFFAFPFALFPFIADKYDATWSLGFMYTALSVGELIASATSGWSKRVVHHGRWVLFAGMAWGLSVGAAGLVGSIWWVLGCLVFAGAADMVSGLFRMLIWNLTIPDELRGRMAGIELLSYSIGPQLGQVRSTVTARLTSIRGSLIIGGALCVGSAGAMRTALPDLWKYDSRRFHRIDTHSST